MENHCEIDKKNINRSGKPNRVSRPSVSIRAVAMALSKLVGIWSDPFVSSLRNHKERKLNSTRSHSMQFSAFTHIRVIVHYIASSTTRFVLSVTLDEFMSIILSLGMNGRYFARRKYFCGQCTRNILHSSSWQVGWDACLKCCAWHRCIIICTKFLARLKRIHNSPKRMAKNNQKNIAFLCFYFHCCSTLALRFLIAMIVST